MMPYLREPFGSDILKGCRIHKWKTDQEDVLEIQKIRKGFKFFLKKLILLFVDMIMASVCHNPPVPQCPIDLNW